jgi:hypothetical protein
VPELGNDSCDAKAGCARRQRTLNLAMSEATRMSGKHVPHQPPPSGAPAASDQQQREAQLRRTSMRDRLFQLLDWLYPYAAGRADRRKSDR